MNWRAVVVITSRSDNMLLPIEYVRKCHLEPTYDHYTANPDILEYKSLKKLDNICSVVIARISLHMGVIGL